MSLILQLQKLENSQKLNGHEGSNRCKNRPCQISAKHDLEAVRLWLAEYKLKPTTFRTYQKEAERLLLWSVLKQGKPLSSLQRQDFEDYLNFLTDPQPSHIWCGPRGGRARLRGDVNWRPFVGQLSPSARASALAIIDSMMNYLVQASYLEFNPLSLMRRQSSRQIRLQINQGDIQDRILEDEDWQLMLETLHNWPETTSRDRDEKARLRFVVAILYLLGLRIQELQNHTWGAFRQIQGRWWFMVVGKGDKKGKVPVNESLLEEVKRFRKHLKLPELPTPGDLDPLVTSWNQNAAIGTRQLSNLVKKLAMKAIEQIDDDHRAERLKKFSPHWLRHLSASMQDRVGIRFGHIKANHRHESDDTTRRYVHAMDNERHDDMSKLKLFTSDSLQ